MKILFTGDWHIGNDSWERDRKDDIRNSMAQIAEYVDTHNVDLIIHTGDFFHSFRYPGKDLIDFAVGCVHSLTDGTASQPKMLIIEGNHDWSDLKLWGRFRPDGKINMVGEPGIEYFRDPETQEDFPVFCLPHMRVHELKKEGLDGVVDGLLETAGTVRRGVAAAHFAVENTVPMINEPVLTKNALSKMAKSGFNTVFCGHIHTHEKIDEAPRKTDAYYTGTIFRTSFGEEEKNIGCWLYDTKTGRTTDLPLVSRELVTLVYKTKEEAAEKISLDVGDAERKGMFVRVVVEDMNSPSEIRSFIESVLPDSDPVVTVKGNAGEERPRAEMVSMLSSLPESQDGTINIQLLWREYVKESVREEQLGTRIALAGEALLNGADPTAAAESLMKNMKDVPMEELLAALPETEDSPERKTRAEERTKDGKERKKRSGGKKKATAPAESGSLFGNDETNTPSLDAAEQDIFDFLEETEAYSR